MTPAELFDLLPDMAVFARVVEAGNFSVAARQLGSTPSTVSRQIKRLEDALATRLLERSTRSVRVTESGAQVVRFCRDMVSAASGAVDAAGQLSGRAQGKVSLSAPTQFARAVIHPLIAGFLRAYEEVDLQLRFTDHDVDPLADDVDLVIRLTEHPPQGLAGRRLGTVRWLLAASPAYLLERGTPGHPRDLLKHACIYLGETADDNRWRFRRGAETHSVDVKGRYIANHVGARLEAALQDFGVASVPQFAAEAALQRGELVQVLPEWRIDAHPYAGSVWLLYPPNRFLPPKVRALIDYLVEHLHVTDNTA
ncbi:LysR family transcriptional regulator [Paraburkholderia metrosideri]|jgi:DNA-binding transcriptional LysR family regulator|uniref:HTH-type transcriptional regulator DmlR n=1 Tax=Paraburkholderia metrosideri TaxID=580937 RepID=A0ABN7HBZ8_9BURK|nr:LysR family transcriptional regulator [Paraburkholderia metrosideri]CAD6507234.1 HTH-type transcriptional regulator DmlR [Paraburkholderia metrosideri]